MVTANALAGLLFGVGVLLVALAFARSRPSLSGAVARAQPPARLEAAAPSAPADRIDALARRLGAAALRVADDLGIRFESARAELAITERNIEEHIAATLGCAVLCPVLVVAGSQGLVLMGLGGLPRLGWLVVLAAVGGFLLPRLSLRAEARRRRAEFGQTVEYVALLAASVVVGGAGPDSAVRVATRPGDNWAAQRLRNALDRAWTYRQAPWEALRELADELGASDLSDFAAKVARTGTHGALVRDSLLVQAREMRTQRRHEEAAAARAATSRMPYAIAWIAYSFLGLIAYLAFAQITGSIV